MPSPYLTEAQAQARLLSRFGLQYTPFEAHLTLASDEVDAAGPFVGIRYSPIQTRKFPRTVLRPGDTVGVTPESVLDFVALRAAQLSVDPEPAVSSEGAGGVSVSYAKPKKSKLETLVIAAYKSLDVYQVKVGSLR